jgi:hypothetical protein
MARRSFGGLRRLPSGRWQASYTDSLTGKRVVGRSTFATKADASVWLATVQADQSRGDFLDPRMSRRRFSEWADDWLKGLRVKPKTLLALLQIAQPEMLHVCCTAAFRPPRRVSRAPRKTHPDQVIRSEPEVGVEPTTYRLQGGCSDQLSYSGGAVIVRPRPAEPEE